MDLWVKFNKDIWSTSIAILHLFNSYLKKQVNTVACEGDDALRTL